MPKFDIGPARVDNTSCTAEVIAKVGNGLGSTFLLGIIRDTRNQTVVPMLWTETGYTLIPSPIEYRKREFDLKPNISEGQRLFEGIDRSERKALAELIRATPDVPMARTTVLRGMTQVWETSTARSMEKAGLIFDYVKGNPDA